MVFLKLYNDYILKKKTKKKLLLSISNKDTRTSIYSFLEYFNILKVVKFDKKNVTIKLKYLEGINSFVSDKLEINLSLRELDKKSIKIINDYYRIKKINNLKLWKT